MRTKAGRKRRRDKAGGSLALDRIALRKSLRSGKSEWVPKERHNSTKIHSGVWRGINGKHEPVFKIGFRVTAKSAAEKQHVPAKHVAA